MEESPEYLTQREAAELLRAGISTLERWRREGKGPPWYRVERRVLYPRAEVEAWLRDRAGQ